jgi:hypothetical protein
MAPGLPDFCTGEIANVAQLVPRPPLPHYSVEDGALTEKLWKKRRVCGKSGRESGGLIEDAINSNTQSF